MVVSQFRGQEHIHNISYFSLFSPFRSFSLFSLINHTVFSYRYCKLLLYIRDVSVFYLFRHLTSTRADLARLGGEFGGKLRGQVHSIVLFQYASVTLAFQIVFNGGWSSMSLYIEKGLIFPCQTCQIYATKNVFECLYGTPLTCPIQKKDTFFRKVSLD